jgi:uncharacterized phage-associated protein
VFSVDNTVLLAAKLLDKAGGELNIIKLMKLLYICDREAIAAIAQPITFDKFVSMDHGPVLSGTYDLMNGSSKPSIQHVWDRVIGQREGHRLSLKGDTRIESNDFIDRIVNKVWGKFGRMGSWDLVEYTHTNFEEWDDPYGSSTPIQYVDVMRAVGFGREEAMKLASELENQCNENRTFDMNRMTAALQAEELKIPANADKETLRDLIKDFATHH